VSLSGAGPLILVGPEVANFGSGAISGTRAAGFGAWRRHSMIRRLSSRQMSVSPRPGVDVMITIFCDFPQFSAKKIDVFLKYQCYDQLFSKFSFVLSQKCQFFH
jgi:hypothetical protein